MLSTKLKLASMIRIPKSLNKNVFAILFAILCIQVSNAQNYPPSEVGEYPDSRPHQNPSTFPGLLEPFNVDVNDLQVTRISDKNMSSDPNLYQMRHDYSKDQCWNADGSEIMLAAYGGQAQILDGETYEFLRWAQNIPSRQRWSYTNPDIMYGVIGNRLVSVHATTGVITTLHTFSEYTSIDLGLGEGNQSNDDRYWAILGKRNGWDDTDFVTYDLETDTILGTLGQGDLGGLIDWVSMTQNGEYFVVRYNAYGNGTQQGIKRWNKDFTGQFNIWSNPQHGDIGIAVNGNPVWVTIGSGAGHYLHMTDMVTGVTTGLVWHSEYGIEGAHVSCRNVSRPGWAYISVEPPVNDVNRHRMTREMFAVKLDNSDTFERWGFHNASSRTYWQQPHVTPNHDGTKVMFASSWGSTTIDNDNYAPTFVTEVGSGNAVNISAGDDVSICDGETTTLTASGAITYSWNNGGDQESINVSPTTTTTYTVTGFAEDGANLGTDEVIVTVNEIPTANAGDDIETCLGTPVTLTATGGGTYEWSNGGETAIITVNPTTTTTYTVQVSQNNCSSTDEVTVTVNEVPDVDAGEDQTIFDGESALLTATGADSYLWSTGETTASITVNPLLDTSYSVTGTTNNCESTDTVTVFLLDDSVNANAGADTEICIGESTILTATGGTTYLWNTGETTASIEVSPTEITTYTVTAYSLSGTNFEDDSVIVSVNEIPVANAGDDVAICFGNVTTLSASGGTSYLWSTGETTETITVNPTETTIYTVEAFENNCSSIDQTEVTVNDLPATNAGDDVSIIEGFTTTLTASNADSYVWSTGETTPSITVNPNNTTTYTVTGANSNGCEFMDEVIVTTMSDDVAANAGDDITICNGESTTLTASGGTTYLWNTGETTASIEVSPIEITTYTVTAYSLSGTNFEDDSVIVSVNQIPVANAGDDVSICFGNTTTLTASGGTTYLWSTGETTQTIIVNPNSTTIYTVEVFENNCSSIDQTQVTVNDLPETNAGSNVMITEGESTTLTASGAASYVWSTGETTPSITVNPIVTTAYTVTGTNSNECEFSDDVTVSVGVESVTANAGSNVTICNGESATLTATGGASYLWNTGETTASITVNPNETTSYTVTAFNTEETASDDDSVNVIVNALPETNAGTNISIFEGDSTTLTASGAASYVWSTGETASSITVSPTSTTTYTVTGNSNGCESIDDVIVSVETENINANAGANASICNGQSTTLTATGGASYLWSTGETTGTIEVSPVTTSTYTVTAFSANGSESDDDNVTVTVNEMPVADAGDNVVICFGNETTLTASGGATYIWSTGETTQNIIVNPNSTTTYSVEVSTNNCSSTDDVIVTVNDLPATNAGNDITIIEGDSTTLTATGAASYVWNTGETTSSISVNPNITTTYTVTGVSNGCESIDEVIVTVELYTASAGSNQTICQGYETTLTASEGDSYLWSTGETTQSITVNPSNTQTYTVTVFEGNYQADAEVQVGVNPNPNVVITNGNDVMILEGEFVTLSASGANTYSWNNGATQPNIAVSPSATTTYEVTGFINNCEDTTAIIVNVLETVQADAGEDLIICSDETVTLTANGGDEYLWNNGETTQSIEVSPNEDTEYSVLVYNALDSDEDSIIVFVEECSSVEIPIESETFDFVIYQDPTTDILNVRIDGLQSVTAKGYTIYDLAGKVIYTEIFNTSEMEDLSQMRRELDVSTYSRGVYIIRLIYDDTSLIKKIPIR
jgi:tRNA A58 N-methylase Trm61